MVCPLGPYGLLDFNIYFLSIKMSVTMALCKHRQIYNSYNTIYSILWVYGYHLYTATHMLLNIVIEFIAIKPFILARCMIKMT